ncbi:hypothetical protein Dimus_028603 [Dionaea muscipula]
MDLLSNKESLNHLSLVLSDLLSETSDLRFVVFSSLLAGVFLDLLAKKDDLPIILLQTGLVRLGMLVICRRSSEPRIPQWGGDADDFHGFPIVEFMYLELIWLGIVLGNDMFCINKRVGRGHGNKVALDIHYHHNMLISHQKVNPKEAIIGW